MFYPHRVHATLSYFLPSIYIIYIHGVFPNVDWNYHTIKTRSYIVYHGNVSMVSVLIS